MTKKKALAYNVVISQDSFDRDILIMLRAIGKYLYFESDKLLKSKPKEEKWDWTAGDKKK